MNSMTLSRRSFLGKSATFGALSPLLTHPEIVAAIQTAGAMPSSAPTAGETYWKNLYASGSERGESISTPNPDRDPRIALYDNKYGLRWVQDIKPTELPSFTEDAVVTLELTGFRAGTQDSSQLAKVKFAQLHLSCQRVTGSDFLGPIVWGAIATLSVNKAASIPSRQSLTWSAQTVNSSPSSPSQTSGGTQIDHIVLNGGAGQMSVNITTTPVASLLDKIADALIQETTKILTPLLGLPGITQPAMQNFYTFYGSLEKSHPENFLLNSEQQDVVVTQQGADNSLISAEALKLVSGTYVFLPQSQENDLEKEMDKLVVQNGYLVDRNSTAVPDTRIKEAVPTVSYVTLDVKVEKASDFPATSTVTDPMLDSPSPKANTSSRQKSDTNKKP
jgi:hypothetical protein